MHYTYISEQIPLDLNIYKAYQKYLSGYSDTLIAYQRINDGGSGFLYDKKVATIESKSGIIEFIYNSEFRADLENSKKLNSVEAYSKQNGNTYLVRRFDFYHSYFESCTTQVYSDANAAKVRLKLDSISEINGSLRLPSYKFYYNYSIYRQLPSRYSYAQDIWGYYNGQDTNRSFVPAVYVYPERSGSDRFRFYPVTNPVSGHGFDDEYILPGANRLPNDATMTIGMLEAIQTPTNETISLYYEPHEFTYYYDDDQTTYIGCGLRLTEKSGSITEKYYYDGYVNGNPSGQILSLPCYGYFDPSSWPEDPQDRDQDFFNDNFVRVTQNLSSFLDGSILYKEVYIKDAFIGTRIFKFDNGPILGENNYESYNWFKPTQIYHCRTLSDYNYQWEPNLQGLDTGLNAYPFIPSSLYFWHRGLLIETLSLNEEDSKVARTVNNYDIFMPDDEAPDSVCGIQVGFLKLNAPGYWRGPLYVYGKYPVYGNLSTIISKTKEIIFNPENDQDSLYTQTYYEYNDYGQLVRNTIINSNGDELITGVKYIPDYWNTMTTPTTSDLMVEAVIDFYNNNIIGIPVETLQYVKKDGEEDLFVTGGTINTFKFFELNNRLTPVPMPDSTFILALQNPVNAASYTNSRIENLTFIKDSRYLCKIANDVYSPSGVLLQSHIVNGNSNVLVPGYDSTVIIASCSNSFLDEFGYTGFELGESNGWEGFGYVAEIINAQNARSGNKVLSPEYNSGVQRNFYIQEGLESQAGYQASVWVIGTSDAQLKISINGTDNIKTAASTSANDWNLLDVNLSREEIEGYQGTIDFIRVTASNTGYATAWFDDIRFHPSDAVFSMSTFDTCYRVSSESGPDNRYSFYEYNALGLPVRVRNHEGNILSENQVVIERAGSGINRYTKTTVLKTEEDDPYQIGLLNPFQKTELYNYYDALGRLEQSVAKKQTAALKDFVNFNIFDSYGRQNKGYLPFQADYDDGRKISNAISEQAEFYISEIDGFEKLMNPYAEVVFDESPLNRITETAHPGASWKIGNGHTDKSDFYFNGENQIVKFRINSSTLNCFTETGHTYFEADSLLCKETTDANGNIYATYYDKTGRTICNKNINNSQDLYTYYVYNDLGQLAYLIPPEAFHRMQLSSDFSFSPTDQVVDDYIFSYSYDSRGRLKQKKEPGRLAVYYIYDNLDRLIMTQDGNQRSSNKWSFISYDVHGRIVITGIYTIGTQLSQSQMQQSADTYLSNSANRNYEIFICENCTTQYETGYSHESFPYYDLNYCQMMTVNYYDSYDWDFSDSYPFNSDLAQNTEKIFGKLSAQKVRILNNANPADWLFTVFYYDEKGRLIETIKDNHLGGMDLSLSELDFSGKSSRNWNYHYLDGNTIREYFTPEYDHSERLSKLWYSIDNESNSFVLFRNTYNSLGMLTRKRIHSHDDMAYLQSVDYAYNSRGWLSRINHSNLANDHYYIQLDQYLTSYEAVDGVRYDSLEVVINEIDRDLLELEYNDNKDMKIISIDSAYIYRFQNVDESSLWQIRRGNIDSLAFESLRTVDGRSLTFSFQHVFFDSSDESQWIADSLSTMVRSQLYLAGIHDSTVLDAVEMQVVSRILGSISFIHYNKDTDDLFGEQIYYDADGSTTGLPSIPLYNGNISAIKWQTRQNAGERSYSFAYDNLNRFLQAAYLEKENGLWTRNPGRYNVSGISYDYNGNIQTLDRNGLTGTQGGVNTYGQMDGLTYTYSGNKLKAVEDIIDNSGANNNDFKDNNVHETVEYEYDNNGNLVSDDNKGIESITYNHLNLPEEIVFSQTQKITYLYAADGRKLSETITDGQMTHTFDYCGNMVYEDGLLSYILNPAGRAFPTGQAHEYTYEYFLHDHLGNVRVVFGDPDRDHEAEIIQENHYYPFGMTMAGLDYSAGLENRYLYQGKERTGDFNLWWSDFHARRFDSQLGRWHVPDPAGQFASAYVGMGNNPVSMIDPDGMFVDKIKGSPLTGKQLYVFSKFLWFHGYRYNNGGWHPPQSMTLKMITSDYEQPWWERESEEQRARAVELSFRLDRMGISSTTHDGGIVVQYEWANGKEAGNILIKSWDEFYANFSNWVDNYATGEQVSSIKQGFGNSEGGGGEYYNNQYGNPSASLNEFASYYKGKTENQIVFGQSSFLGYKFPNDINKQFRFVEIGNGREVDMIHFMVVGRRGQALGVANELKQALSFSKSAFYPQDLYSNKLGVNFFNRYESVIQQNPTRISEYIQWFLSNPDNW